MKFALLFASGIAVGLASATIVVTGGWWPRSRSLPVELQPDEWTRAPAWSSVYARLPKPALDSFPECGIGVNSAATPPSVRLIIDAGITDDESSAQPAGETAVTVRRLPASTGVFAFEVRREDHAGGRIARFEFGPEPVDVRVAAGSYPLDGTADVCVWREVRTNVEISTWPLDRRDAVVRFAIRGHDGTQWRDVTATFRAAS